MSSLPFTFAISSLSCAPANIFRPYEILLPPIATTQTVLRLSRMKDLLKDIIPSDQFTTSFHVGYLISTLQAIKELEKHDIQVSSLDTPDIRTLFQCLQQAIKTIQRSNLKEFKENIGWQLASVTTYQNYERKVRNGLDSLNENSKPQFVRTSGGSWYKSEVGNTLIQILKEKRKLNPSLALAIEIDARNQTPHEYFSFVQKLNELHPDLPIYFDLDVGHLAESLVHHATFEHETLLELVDEVLTDRSKSSLIGIVSLNQYDHQTKDIHVSLMKGSIDYIKIIEMLGEASRKGNLSIPPTLLAEFSPMEYDVMTSPEGIDYIASVIKAFNNN